MPDPGPGIDPSDSRRVPPDRPGDPPGEAVAPERSLGEAAVSGSLWTLVQVVVVKIVSLCGTLTLMHLLSPDVFGVATLALSVAAMMTVLQPFTMGDVILAQSRDLARISGTAHRLGLLTSLLFVIAIAASGPWVAAYYGTPALALACAWVAFRPLSDWMVVLPLTRLRAGLQFRTISTVDALSLTSAMVTSVVMAAAGLGMASVIIPPIVFTAIRAWLYRRAAPAPPSPAWLPGETRSLFPKFLLSGLGQYVHGGLIMVTPLLVGAFTGKREVGWYAMAFTMSAQINTVVGFGMGLVLQPIFAQMSDNVARQSTAFLKACRVLATLAMPICLLQAVLAPSAFRLFLPEKWEGAIVLAQILSLGQAFFFSVNPAIGLLTAQGRFGAYMTWQTVQLVIVVAGMLGAGLLWREAPLIPIVLVGGLYHAFSAPIGVWIGVRGRGASFATCLGVFLRPLLFAAISVLPAGWLLSRVLPAGAPRDIVMMALLPVIAGTAFVSLVRRFDRPAAEDCGRMIESITRRLRRRPGATP